MSEEEHVLIKRGLYWRPEGCGYTGVLADAGRYTAWEAASTRDHDQEVKSMPASEAPEFSPACWEEMKLRARTKERDAAEARASAAEAEVAKLTRERDRAEQNETFTASRSAEIERQYAISQATVSALRDRVAVLEEALTGLLNHYTGMVNSGDCGFWDPENESVVKSARAALTQGGENAKA